MDALGSVSAQSSLQCLPPHLLQEILQRLQGRDLASIECTCRTMSLPNGLAPLPSKPLPELVAYQLCLADAQFQCLSPEVRDCILEKLGGSWKALEEYLCLVHGSKSKRIMVAAGRYHTIVVRQDGTVFSLGFSSYGVLGHGPEVNHSLPRPLNLCGRGRVSQISASFNHAAFVTDQGEVFTYGDNSSWCCGHGFVGDRIFEPTLVETLQSIPCKKVATGLSFTVVLTCQGKVYSFGSNSHGQLGHGDTTDKSVPMEVQSLNSYGRPMTKISAGRSHTLVVAEDGCLFTCGYGGNFCLGHGGTDNELRPRLVEDFQRGDVCILDAVAGSEHCIAMDWKGRIYTWGKGYCGALGHGDEQDCHLPVMLTSLGKLVPVQVCAGHRKSFVVGFDGTVVAFGWVYLDGKVLQAESVEGLSSRKIASVTTGFYHTIFITRTGSLLGFGDNDRAQLGASRKAPAGDPNFWKSPQEIFKEFL